MDTQDNIQIVQELYSAFGRQDVPRILNTLAKNVAWHEPLAGEAPFQGVYRGREAVGRFFRGLAEAVEVLAFEPREFIAQGDVVIALGSYRFRARGTGRTYETDWVMVWRFHGGEVVRFDIYKDSAAEAAALRGM